MPVFLRSCRLPAPLTRALQQGFDGDAHDRAYPQRLGETIYRADRQRGKFTPA